MNPRWTLHGNFFRYHIEIRTKETSGTNLAKEMNVDPATITRLSNGSWDPNQSGDKYRAHLLPSGLSIQAATLYWSNFKASYLYLKGLEDQIGAELPPGMPGLAKIYLADKHYIDEQGIATTALVDWKSNRSRPTELIEPETSPKANSQMGANLKPKLPPRVSTGGDPENFVGDLCKVGAIKVEHRMETNALNVFYKLAFGFTSRRFGDLIARCGLKEAKVSSEFSSLQVIRYHHADEPLRGRLARLTDTDEFVVKQTSAGVPDPFLLDSVFDDAPICSAEPLTDYKALDITLTCSVEFSDLKVIAYSADGEKFPSISKEQRELRKRALELFILDRCLVGGFKGTIATTGWHSDEHN